MSYDSTYRWCVVRECKNTSVKAPNKLWMQVPNNIHRKKTWFEAAGIDLKLLEQKSRLYFCEDHFDLPNDMENYTQYKVMGSIKRIRMKPQCVPSIFDCKRNIEIISEPHSTVAKKIRKSIDTESTDTATEDDNIEPSPCIKGKIHQKKRKKRGSNYSQEEISVFIDLIAEFKHVVDDKRSDSEYLKKKKYVWDLITVKYNSKCSFQRETKQLKALYDNIKKNLRRIGKDQGRISLINNWLIAKG